MLQFYFLSIALNALAGYILFFDETGTFELGIGLSAKNETFKLVVGILSVVTGFFKLLSPVEGDIPIIGDLVPMAAGFLCGFTLILEYYRNRSSSKNSIEDSVDDSGHTTKFRKFLLANKKIIGAAAFIAAILHFLFPRVLFL